MIYFRNLLPDKWLKKHKPWQPLGPQEPWFLRTGAGDGICAVAYKVYMDYISTSQGVSPQGSSSHTKAGAATACSRSTLQKKKQRHLTCPRAHSWQEAEQHSHPRLSFQSLCAPERRHFGNAVGTWRKEHKIRIKERLGGRRNRKSRTTTNPVLTYW